MASIFTFDPDPPRVFSPWFSGANQHHGNGVEPKLVMVDSISDAQSSMTVMEARDDTFEETTSSIFVPSRLEAEPQEGPMEYKLHLLLRPRRSHSYLSTARHSSGSRPRSSPSTPRNVSESSTGISTPLSQTSASRQHRLEQLTTQLLWRLQQSSPYHSSSAHNLILPILSDAATELRAPSSPAKLLPGLEDSKGALYEIGVSDDGTFVGLAEDEMDESLNNLRAMAASLGCSVSILRMVQVGECEWYEENDDDLFENSAQVKRGKLYVAEAYVKPVLKPHDAIMPNESRHDGSVEPELDVPCNNTTTRLPEVTTRLKPSIEQLRVSLTGATTCGKSSLLGTLSTSTLDNGRGKSRLSLLKHRHEIASGMTSSVAQELIGYHDLGVGASQGYQSQVVNYAAGNVSSWDDIHAASEPGRLAFLSDCAGHPRYRRTTVRGLVGWAPHWIVLCIAANDSVDRAGENNEQIVEGGGHDFSGASAHISMAHLELCLRLEIPLVVVITKLDLASKTSTRQVLTTLLTSLKAAGRKPAVLRNDSSQVVETDLRTISERDVNEVLRLEMTKEHGQIVTVPILFTSAMKGTGIGKLHALLRHLPISRVPTRKTLRMNRNATKPSPSVLFHLDDSFNLSSQEIGADNDYITTSNIGSIISGHLLYGSVSIGDELTLGPFSTSVRHDSEDSNPPVRSSPADPFLSPRSFSSALARATSFLSNRTTRPEDEWHRVRVISIRNLRLPTRKLDADQAGTLGIVALDDTLNAQTFVIRKGMVLLNSDAIAAHTFTASFDAGESGLIVVGALVVIYCASVRASAKVIAVSLQEMSVPKCADYEHDPSDNTEEGFSFGLDEASDSPDGGDSDQSILVTFQFLSCKEWLGVDSQVLVMPGGGYGGKGQGVRGYGFMDGFVGRVVQRFG